MIKTMNCPLLAVAVDGQGVRTVDYWNYENGDRMMIYRDGNNLHDFHAVKCTVKNNAPAYFGDDNPAVWNQQDVLSYAKTKAEEAFSANSKIKLVIANKEVDFHEFKRNLLNLELKDKIPVEELDTLKAAGGTIAKTIAEIDQNHFITLGQYKQLQEFDKKTGGKLHL